MVAAGPGGWDDSPAASGVPLGQQWTAKGVIASIVCDIVCTALLNDARSRLSMA